MRVASVGCFPGAWRGGSWHFQVARLHFLQSSMDFSFSASHHFSFPSKRSGRRMPPAERSALYTVHVTGPGTGYTWYRYIAKTEEGPSELNIVTSSHRKLIVSLPRPDSKQPSSLSCKGVFGRVKHTAGTCVPYRTHSVIV